MCKKTFLPALTPTFCRGYNVEDDEYGDDGGMVTRDYYIDYSSKLPSEGLVSNVSDLMKFQMMYVDTLLVRWFPLEAYFAE